MKTYRLAITPWRDRSCHRSVELDEHHTLADLHQVIQHEFELDDDHLWAFYLSGKFFDRGSEFGVGSGTRSPHSKLGGLALSPKMRFGYLFDFGDEHRHDVVVEAVGESPGRIGAPRVLDRQGTPPKQYPEEAPDEPWSDARPEPPAPAAFSPEALEIADDLAEWSDEVLFGDGIPEDRQEGVLAGVRRLLGECEDRAALRGLGKEVGSDVEEALGDVLFALWKANVAPRAAVEELEWRVARLPSDRGGFPATLVDELRWIAKRIDDSGVSPAQRFRYVPTELLERVTRGVLAACPDAARLQALARAADTDVVEGLAAEGLPLLAPTLSDEELEQGLRVGAEVLERSTAYFEAARTLHEAGRTARARELIDLLDPARVLPEELVDLAETLELLGAPERGQQLLGEALQRPWLAELDRAEIAESLTGMLSRAGREAEANAVVRAEAMRAHEERAQRSATVIRTGEKVGRNDPCPCGSGKKAKKCCGAV